MPRTADRFIRSRVLSSVLRRGSALALAVALTAVAQGASAQALAAKGGTIGLGAEFSYGVTSLFGVRAGVNGGSYSRTYNESDIRYDGKLKFSSGLLLADLHPFAGSFRISGGAMINNNKADLLAQPESGTITINGVPYPAAAVGTVNGTVEFERFSPYLGIGWGAAPKSGAGVFFAADIGAVFQKPKSTLVGTCAPTLPAPICTQLLSDLRAEERQFQDAVDSAAKIYPVVTLGIGYRF
jgi:hypothetical protein